ncbi:MAG: GNAT family N-acetyltransferase [Geminicoccaceae bacterium]
MKIDFHPPLQLSTDRLVLRKPRLGDAAQIFDRYAGDDEVVKFLEWRVHRAESETLQFLQTCLSEWHAKTSFPYVIEMNGEASGPIGMIDARPQGHRASFGYVLARPYWGCGYVVEALTALVDWFLNLPGIWRASAFCDVDNHASARVMEKAGMTFEGILCRYATHPNISSEPRDCRIFARVL